MNRFILIAALFVVPATSQSAGFDCSKASSPVEELICEDTPQSRLLSELDSRMSSAYEQAITVAEDPRRLKEEQRRWLRDVRDHCSDPSCLEIVYTDRIQQLLRHVLLISNEKEEAICKTVVDAVNDGSIAKRFMPFEMASEDDTRAWAENRSNFSSLYLRQTLKINAHGKPITLGLVRGGGTCGNCDIENINALETEVYPPDDSEERFRWKGWGQCDHFLFVEGEPVIVTGNFGWGQSRATFVTWLAPDGAKRALCYLGPDQPRKTKIKLVKNNNPGLCDAVAKNRIEEIPWSTSLTIPREDTGNDATMWNSSKGAMLDINLDGRKETIVLFDHASGAGCGSYRQWLREFTPQQRSAFPEESQSSTETPLSKIFASSGLGPVKGTKQGDEWHGVKLFRYAGKPYILGQGTDASAEVISVWKNQKKSWCEYQVLPQHRVEIYYPAETWPTLTISEFKKTKGAQALHNAARNNDKEKVMQLIKSGTPIDVVDDSGQTPLGEAVFMGHMDMVKLLLDNGALIDGVKSWLGSPLMQATTWKKVEIVEFLLSRKANPNIRSEPNPAVYGDKGSTALGIAMKAETYLSRNPESEEAKKNKRIIELLLKAGVTQ